MSSNHTKLIITLNALRSTTKVSNENTTETCRSDLIKKSNH